VIKRIYELSKSSKLIYKAALKGKELSIITYVYIFNLIAVIPSSANKIIITTKAPNIVEKDKEEHSYITVSDIKLSPKDAYFNYKSANKDLD